LGAAAFSRET